MASTTFVSKTGVIPADWLNDVNTLVWGVFAGSTTIGQVKTLLGVLAAGPITTSGLTQATSRLLGRTTASTGAIEELTVGSGLTLSAGSLAVSGAFTASGLTQATNRLLGRTTASTGATEEISVGNGLTFSSGSISISGIAQSIKSAAYTTVLADANTHLLHPSADTTARIFTIDSNATVAYPIGTAITIVNQNAAGVITISINTDTMRLAGAGTTGSRTLAANGIATALKITSTEWIISGTGLT
jgi:hypothetical protein